MICDVYHPSVGKSEGGKKVGLPSSPCCVENYQPTLQRGYLLWMVPAKHFFECWEVAATAVVVFHDIDQVIIMAWLTAWHSTEATNHPSATEKRWVGKKQNLSKSEIQQGTWQHQWSIIAKMGKQMLKILRNKFILLGVRIYVKLQQKNTINFISLRWEFLTRLVKISIYSSQKIFCMNWQFRQIATRNRKFLFISSRSFDTVRRVLALHCTSKRIQDKSSSTNNAGGHP